MLGPIQVTRCHQCPLALALALACSGTILDCCGHVVTDADVAPGGPPLVLLLLPLFFARAYLVEILEDDLAAHRVPHDALQSRLAM